MVEGCDSTVEAPRYRFHVVADAHLYEHGTAPGRIDDFVARGVADNDCVHTIHAVNHLVGQGPYHSRRSGELPEQVIAGCGVKDHLPAGQRTERKCDPGAGTIRQHTWRWYRESAEPDIAEPRHPVHPRLLPLRGWL